MFWIVVALLGAVALVALIVVVQQISKKKKLQQVLDTEGQIVAEPAEEPAEEVQEVAEEAPVIAEEEAAEAVLEAPVQQIPAAVIPVPAVQVPVKPVIPAGPSCDVNLWVEQLTRWCQSKGMQCIQSVDNGDVYLHVYLPHKRDVHTVGNWCFPKDTRLSDLAAEITKLYAYCEGFADCFGRLIR